MSNARKWSGWVLAAAFAIVWLALIFVGALPY